ncbi:hypothetical protein LZ554_007813 [Drepanopeziza brunnea f. sp. 'monogermtubi']|nr:hypothetical protein LZ554_007813 [Drepanopeziza brunnea f. sp. 'monogermtubi']
MSSFLARRALRNSSPVARAFSTSSPRSSFARMTILGRLAAPPELHPTSTGQDVLRYAVASNSGGYGDNQKTSYFSVSAFVPPGPRRDFFQGLEKGTMVYVEGEASNNKFTDKNGNEVYGLSIVQRQFEVLSPKKMPEQQ